MLKNLITIENIVF